MPTKRDKKQFMEFAPTWAVLLYTVAVIALIFALICVPGVLTIPIYGTVTEAEAEQAYTDFEELWAERCVNSWPVTTAFIESFTRFNLWTRNAYFVKYELGAVYTTLDLLSVADITVNARDYADKDERFQFLLTEFSARSERPLTVYNDAVLAFDFQMLRNIENAKSEGAEAESLGSLFDELYLSLFKYKMEQTMLFRLAALLLFGWLSSWVPAPLMQRMLLWRTRHKRKWLL